MKLPHSDFLIRKYTDKDGDQLLVFNEPPSDGDPALTICVACPHRDEENVMVVAMRIPVDVLDEYLDDLADERDGKDIEEGNELIELPDEEEDDE